MAEKSFEAGLAKRTVEAYIRDRCIIELPEDLPERLTAPAGVFVSLKEQGMLRGCIGTIEPTQDNAAAEIIQNAISAAVSDPRFMPVTSEELNEIEYSVDVLGESEPVESVGELDPSKYGLIVEAGDRRGLLLPDIEGVDSVDEQIKICKRKAGLREDDAVRMFRFKVTRYE